jgi:hypothetical protein
LFPAASFMTPHRKSPLPASAASLVTYGAETRPCNHSIPCFPRMQSAIHGELVCRAASARDNHGIVRVDHRTSHCHYYLEARASRRELDATALVMLASRIGSKPRSAACCAVGIPRVTISAL